MAVLIDRLTRLRVQKPTRPVVRSIEVERWEGDEEGSNDVAEVRRDKRPGQRFT